MWYEQGASHRLAVLPHDPLCYHLLAGVGGYVTSFLDEPMPESW